MEKTALRIVFMGTPNISSFVLKRMIEEGFNIVGVVAQKDKPVGRKKIIMPVPTKVVAMEHNIPVFQPEKIRLDYQFLKEIAPDVIVTIAYGQIVPQAVLDIPKYGCLNLHGSLLPKYRGASPIQTSLLNNDEVTGVTLMEMTKDMDAGRMYAKKEVKISKEDNTTSLFEKIGVAAAELIIEALPKYIDGELVGVEQDENEVSFCHMITKEDEKIDINASTKEIYGKIRALSDEPGAYVILDDKKLKIFISEMLENKVNAQNGQIIQSDKNGLVFKTVDGAIKIISLQEEGKNRMDYRSFVNGHPNLIGKILK